MEAKIEIGVKYVIYCRFGVGQCLITHDEFEYSNK
jgi:hypothetical protein